MRVDAVPACYAPFIEAAIKEAIRRANQHATFDASDADERQLRQGFVSDAEIDPSRTGELVVIVGESPAEDHVRIVPLMRAFRVAS